MRIKSNSKIEELKKKAKKHYIAYCDGADKIDCGLSLAEHILSDLMYHKIKFNKIMDELAEIDPGTPTARL